MVDAAASPPPWLVVLSLTSTVNPARAGEATDSPATTRSGPMVTNFSAVLLASIPLEKQNQLPIQWREAMDEMSEVARKAYRQLVYETPGFIDFWQTATPLDEIKRFGDEVISKL